MDADLERLLICVPAGLFLIVCQYFTGIIAWHLGGVGKIASLFCCIGALCSIYIIIMPIKWYLEVVKIGKES